MNNLRKFTDIVLKKLKEDGWSHECSAYKTMATFMSEAEGEIESEPISLCPVDPSKKFVPGEFYRLGKNRPVECLFTMESGCMLYSYVGNNSRNIDQVSAPFSDGGWLHVPGGDEIRAVRSRLSEIEAEASSLKIVISEWESK